MSKALFHKHEGRLCGPIVSRYSQTRSVIDKDSHSPKTMELPAALAYTQLRLLILKDGMVKRLTAKNMSEAKAEGIKYFGFLYMNSR